MAVNPDFRDLFSVFNAASVRYLLVGGYAVGFHAEPRFTKDLDVWIEASPLNAQRAYDALRSFGAPVGELSVGDLAGPDRILQIGVPPNRIDIVTSIDGVQFDTAWAERVETQYGDQTIQVIGRAELVANKLACGRPQDLLDVELLQRHFKP
jgi:hypothetical protein